MIVKFSAWMRRCATRDCGFQADSSQRQSNTVPVNVLVVHCMNTYMLIDQLMYFVTCYMCFHCLLKSVQ